MARRNRRNGRRRSNGNGGLSGLVNLLPFVLGALLLGVVGLFFFSTQKDPTDAKFCPKDKGNLGMTAFIVDVSDNLTSNQTARLQNELENISNVSAERSSAFLEKGEKMLVYFTKPEGYNPSLVFDLCHPGDIANRTWDEDATEGKFFAQRKWQKFKSGMMSKINSEIDNSTEMDTSPIIETIQYVRDKHFPPPDLMNGKANYRIVVWSDMLQHSKESNHFQSLENTKDVLKRNPMNLDGIEVRIFYLMSEKYSDRQTGEHQAWWRKIFSLSHGDLKQMRPI